MEIKRLNLALASGITAAIFWLICSLLVWTLPGPMMNMSGHMVHLEMERFGWMLTPLGVLGGLIAWSLFAGFFAFLLATVYNLLSRGDKE